jgi:hypothetical protein
MNPEARFSKPLGACLAACCAAAPVFVHGQEFQMTSWSLTHQGQLVMHHMANSVSYYTLCRGTEVTHIVSAVHLALALPVDGYQADYPPALSVLLGSPGTSRLSQPVVQNLTKP